MDPEYFEEQLLCFAKDGSCPQVQHLLQLRIKLEHSLDINCRGRKKFCAGWTPLHLASYFGHKNVVEELLKAGAHVNLQNNTGDTPLHKAALTGRKEIVLLLLRYDACANIINGTAQIPKDVTEDDEIITMLEAAERREERRMEERLLEAAREGDMSTLSQLLSRRQPPDIQCRDPMGNTPLHCSAYRGHRHCVLKLLKCGASPSIKNKTGQTPFDLACTDDIRQVVAGVHDKDLTSVVQTYEGHLWKTSRFLGWRSHWVVLKKGVLSWYPRQADAMVGSRRQGCKALTQAYCVAKAGDEGFFTLRCLDDTVHHFKVSSKRDPEATRTVRWNSHCKIKHLVFVQCYSIRRCI